MALKVPVYLCMTTILTTILAQNNPVPFSRSYKRTHLPVPSPALAQITKAILPQPTATPIYSYNYVVQDPYSGDHKTHQESRLGDVVRGRYSLLDPDGTTRVVEYSADPLHGFTALVRKELSNDLHQV